MTLTGKDKEVKDFLNKDVSMQRFLNDDVYDMIDAAVDNYTSRNFSSLMVSFGCTGGQHRSVYDITGRELSLSARRDLPHFQFLEQRRSKSLWRLSKGYLAAERASN